MALTTDEDLCFWSSDSFFFVLSADFSSILEDFTDILGFSDLPSTASKLADSVED